jgi:hypothetical protein
MGRTCRTIREKRNANIFMVENQEGKRPLRKPRRRWENDIKMYLGEIGWGVMDWIGLA